ncbi:MAG: hypothetical protein HY795_14235 [Desulfovibrio sp.]|nr:hypothetical protein [Desulfovibrio sp.]MBI4959450.1 hypothetical protein [Desulfovibrio sp.]
MHLDVEDKRRIQRIVSGHLDYADFNISPEILKDLFRKEHPGFLWEAGTGVTYTISKKCIDFIECYVSTNKDVHLVIGRQDSLERTTLGNSILLQKEIITDL